eukprot:GFYU01002006.1.p1 GENE.GFYU01002006.1~~GFYU01002006.1.p1  ORF type:complete len:542 (+),score=142.44 GFYU01002006.1:65-1690(+)
MSGYNYGQVPQGSNDPQYAQYGAAGYGAAGYGAQPGQPYGQPPPPPQPTYGDPYAQAQPQQGYAYGAEPSCQPSAGAPAPYTSSERENERFIPPSAHDPDRFDNSVTGYQDASFAVLFALHLVAMAVVLATHAKNVHFEKPSGSSSGTNLYTGKTVLVAVGTAVASGALFCAFFLGVLKTYAKQIIWCSLGFSIVCAAISALMFVLNGVMAGFVISLICLALNILYVYLVRHRIPFATALLENTAAMVKAYPATITLALAAIFVQVAWMIFWAFTVVSCINTVKENVRGLVTFMLLISFYWTCNVIKNIVHVTVAGVMASWYFFHGTSGMQENPTVKSLKRASTTSLGSICLGSLIIAVIQAVKAMVHQARKSDNGFARMCVECLLQCLEDIIEFFNKYAFTQVAIYGKPFCTAAKDTWELLRRVGFDMVINDNMIGAALGIAAFFSGLLSAGICAGIGYIYDKDNFTSPNSYLFIGAGILIGIIMLAQTMSVVDSGITSFFVCFAEDPQALRNSKPELYTKLIAAWQLRWGAPPAHCTYA